MVVTMMNDVSETGRNNRGGRGQQRSHSSYDSSSGNGSSGSGNKSGSPSVLIDDDGDHDYHDDKHDLGLLVHGGGLHPQSRPIFSSSTTSSSPPREAACGGLLPFDPSTSQPISPSSVPVRTNATLRTAASTTSSSSSSSSTNNNIRNSNSKNTSRRGRVIQQLMSSKTTVTLPPPRRGLTRLQFFAVGIYFVAAYTGISTFINQGRLTMSSSSSAAAAQVRRAKRRTGGRIKPSSSSSSSSSFMDWDDLMNAPTTITTTFTNSISSLVGSQPLFSGRTSNGGTVAATNNLDKPVVMIVACTKSQPAWLHYPKTSLVYKHFLPSVASSITTTEAGQYNIQILLAYDQGDKFWEKRTVRDWVRKQFPQLQINFMSILKDDRVTRKSRIPFNEACQAAYEYGAEYIVRVNDDTEFFGTGWITMGVSHLSNYEHQVGVVGPTDKVNTKILTHDMVHRTHLDIFDRYYPEKFDNWWIDDWITHVYGEDRTTMIGDWTVINHSRGDVMRYKVDARLEAHLRPTLHDGRQRVQQYLAQTKSVKINGITHTQTTFRRRKHNFCVLGTTRVGLVEGPMDEFVQAARFSKLVPTRTTGPCLSAKDMNWHTSTPPSSSELSQLRPIPSTTTDNIDVPKDVVPDDAASEPRLRKTKTKKVKRTKALRNAQPKDTASGVQPTKTVRRVYPKNSVKRVQSYNTVRRVPPSTTVKSIQSARRSRRVQPDTTFRRVKPLETAWRWRSENVQ